MKAPIKRVRAYYRDRDVVWWISYVVACLCWLIVIGCMVDLVWPL